jgi:hypothetical protein
MSLQTALDYAPASPLERAIAAGWNPVCHITYNRDKLLRI